MKRLFILDANALLHRAWHALPMLTNGKGMVVNCVYGCMMVMMKLMNEQKPDHVIACWDTEAPTFRHIEYKEYKAQREEQPDELYAQVPLVKQGLEALGIPSIEKDGYEADDLIGTIATQAASDGWQVTIVTSDRDALQLVTNTVHVLAFRKGVTDTVEFDPALVLSEYGLNPDQIIDYKAMRGDPSDNLPGIKGIGEKTATELLKAYKDVNGIIKAAHDPNSEIKPAVRQKLLDAEQDLPQLRRLVTIVTDAPIDWKKSLKPAEINADLIPFLREQGFKSLLKKVESDQGSSTNEKEKKTSPTKTTKKSSDRPAVSQNSPTCFAPTSTKEALANLQDISSGKEVIVFIPRGIQNSLFAQQVDGLVFATQHLCVLISPALLEDKQIHKTCQAILHNPTQQKLTHDGKDQIRLLKSLNLTIDAWNFDTMLAAYLLAAGERNHDLAAIAYQFAHVQLPPDASALQQAQALIDLIQPLRKELDAQGLTPILNRFELPLIPVLYQMEEHGIKIDKKYLVDLSKELTGDRATLEQKMIELVGHTFNPASPSQLAVILFDELKLPVKGIKKGKTGYSTAASELEKLRGQHPLIEMIEQHRELSKLLSTYVDVLPTLSDKHDRIHSTFNQAIAATGRLSSTDPNLQNIPIRTELGRRIRRAFIAEPGYQLLSCDYSQIELRIIAALAKDEKMLEAFNHGEDIHAATAANIWSINIKDVTKDQRRIAKAINFGLIFGQGPQGLSQVADITFAEAKQFIANYFEVYKGIKVYMEETKALAHQLGYVETLFGRRRILPEIQSMLPQVRAQAERMAINMPVQGTDADLMKLAMIEIHKRLPQWSPKSRLILQVHDELVFEVPEKEVKEMAKKIQDIMQSVEKIGVPIVVEAKAGNNWGEMEKI